MIISKFYNPYLAMDLLHSAMTARKNVQNHDCLNCRWSLMTTHHTSATYENLPSERRYHQCPSCQHWMYFAEPTCLNPLVAMDPILLPGGTIFFIRLWTDGLPRWPSWMQDLQRTFRPWLRQTLGTNQGRIAPPIRTTQPAAEHIAIVNPVVNGRVVQQDQWGPGTPSRTQFVEADAEESDGELFRRFMRTSPSNP